MYKGKEYIKKEGECIKEEVGMYKGEEIYKVGECIKGEGMYKEGGNV